MSAIPRSVAGLFDGITSMPTFDYVQSVTGMSRASVFRVMAGIRSKIGVAPSTRGVRGVNAIRQQWTTKAKRVLDVVRLYAKTSTPELRLAYAKFERTLLDLALVADGNIGGKESTLCVLTQADAGRTIRECRQGIQPWSCYIGLNPDGLLSALNRSGMIAAAYAKYQKRKQMLRMSEAA